MVHRIYFSQHHRIYVGENSCLGGAACPRVPQSAGRRQRCSRRSHRKSMGIVPSLRAVTSQQKAGLTGTIDMQERMDFLKEDLTHLFDEQGVDQSQYDLKVDFMDPITKYTSVQGYMFNIKMLKTLFAPAFQLHDIKQTDTFEITTRWTMVMQPTFNRIMPFKKWWDPRLVFTGVSVMGVNPETGKFNRHIDLWDALEPENQEYLSREGVAHVFGQLTSLSRAPDLDTPDFTILKKKKHYEIRRYEPFLVAETGMQVSTSESGSNPARNGKGAFNALAGYIFGKNREQKKMKMTTPVFTTSQGKMQFVVGKDQDLSALPAPESLEIETRQLSCGLYAVSQFGGEASEAVAEEKCSALRTALEKDGIDFEASEWILARYNDPSTRPAFRRNEVLMSVKNFDLWAT